MINHNINSCQAIKSDSTTEQPNIYKLNREFLENCTHFVRNINDLESSPWTNDGIVRFAMSELNFRLGKVQRELLRFLQHRYFRKDQPCFVKQSFMAKELGLHRSVINRSLKSLEDKGLITRIQWLYKGRRKNALILPLIPSLTDIFQTQNLSVVDFQKCYIKCSILFCKPPKSQKFSNGFIQYTNILYTNKLFKLNKVNLNSISLDSLNVSDETAVSKETAKICLPEPLDSKCVELKQHILDTEKPPLDRKVLSEKEGDDQSTMLKRFLLKREEASRDHAYQHIFNRLKMNGFDFDKLDINHQNDLKTYIDYFHGIDLREHFKISSHNKSHFNDSKIHLRTLLLRIIASGYELQWDYADKVIAHWNALQIDDKRLQRISANRKTTKNYKNAVIAISHCLIFDAKSDLNALFTAIDRLMLAKNFSKYPFSRRIRNKTSIDTFFANMHNNPYLQAHLGSQLEFERYLHYFTFTGDKDNEQRVNAAYERFVDMYIAQFFSNKEEKGKEICYRFEFHIKRFLDKRIREIIDVNNNGDIKIFRNMDGYSLIEDRYVDSAPIPPLLQRYLHYRTITDGYMQRMIDILNEDAWKDFIETHMRIELGNNDFYKILPISQKGV